MNTSEQHAGMTRRLSPRLHSPIQANRGGHRSDTSPQPAPPSPNPREPGWRPPHPSPPTHLAGGAFLHAGPDDDDMLREILIRLPPEPSSLPRASAVCKRWLGLVSDPKFHHQFFAHHGQPPILGFFEHTNQWIVFNPIIDPPDRIPPHRFSLGRYSRNNVLDCRHGRVLVGDCLWNKMVLVCDPITGEQCSALGAVLCAAGNQGHVHGSCHSSPFKVVLLSMSRSGPLTRVYSSETGGWGNVISTAAPFKYSGDVGTLVGSTLYWLYGRHHILEFDLDGQGLSVIMGPRVVTNHFSHGSRQIIKAEDGAVGYTVLSYPRFQSWQRNVNGHGVATWVLWKTIEMDSILGLPPRIEGEMGWMEIIQGYEEDTDVIFLSVNDSVYMVQLKSMQSRKLDGSLNRRYHPFKSFYTPAIRECNEAAMLHNP